MLLVGMLMPPNYGPRYTQEFRRDVRDARDASSKLALVPFLLETWRSTPELMQADGLHPNARAQPALLENVWPQLKPLLQKPASVCTAK